MIQARNIDLSTFPAAKYTIDNFAIPTTATTKLSHSVTVAGKYLVLCSMTSQTYDGQNTLYMRIKLNSTNSEWRYNTIHANYYGLLEAIDLLEANVGDTIACSVNSVATISASPNTQLTMVVVRVA